MFGVLWDWQFKHMTRLQTRHLILGFSIFIEIIFPIISQRSYDIYFFVNLPFTHNISTLTKNFIYNTYFADFIETFSKTAIPDYLPNSFFIDGGALAVENALKIAFEENYPRYESLKWYLTVIGLDFESTIKKINQIPKLY